MSLKDIENIEKSIRTHLEDLHIIINEDGASIDTQLYNDVTLALLKAEHAIGSAKILHNMRLVEHKKRYGNPRNNVE